jgi:hypothetical protein
VPYVKTWAPPKRFLGYQDIDVFHAYKGEIEMTYWFALHPNGPETPEAVIFDVRDMWRALRNKPSYTPAMDSFLGAKSIDTEPNYETAAGRRAIIQCAIDERLIVQSRTANGLRHAKVMGGRATDCSA